MAQNEFSSQVRLRDYQRECLSAIFERYQAGIRRQLVCLPTGSGKTVIFAEFPRYFKMKKQMLVLAHRAELLDQACEKIRRANPYLTVAVEQADRTADPECDVVVASVPTLGRKGSRRLTGLDPDRFFLIVVDEAHHATADTFKRVLKYLDVFMPETRKLLVGFTATPKRGDGVGLDAVFQEIVYSRSLPEMIKAGHLSPVAAYRVETDIDLSRVKTRMGDFVTSQLSRAVNIEERNDLIVKVFHTHLEGKQTLCFCVDVAHALSLAQAFNREGVSAAAVTGHMDRAEREKELEKFRVGKTSVLANCMVLTEGYDEPSVEGIILARPTKSTLLYTQMIGRGTRLYPGKKNVTVVDIVDVTKEHSLTSLPVLFGLSEQFDLEGHTTDEAERAMEWVEINRSWVKVDSAISLSDLRYRCTRIDLFDLEVPLELNKVASYVWIGLGKGGYRLGLTGGTSVIVAPTILGEWEVQLRKKGIDKTLMIDRDLDSAIKNAETFIKADFPDILTLVRRDSHWRRQPASEKQISVLQSRKIEVPRGLTKGQASHLIGMLP
ncbi:DEAD/DEAH box helicase [uncultured Desulfobacterium sp.]|uniref:DEAD/DEAH box helicase n=1 Tax=uncultured Desulfobacterium sp. TaxID=201089 RepID=A0A445N132_9BACT|nr:DEAD/DEAH box helicase [uncultured Desulfobacterium sp.]